jgi:DNA polymerase-1
MGKNDVINYPVQGAAFHCLLWSLIRIDQILGIKKMDTKLIGQIHDSILLDVHPDELEDVLKMTKTVMEDQLPKEWEWLTVPLVTEAEVCDVDKSWYYKKEYEV